MKRLSLLFITGSVLLIQNTLAQTAQEALTYSYQRMQGTARSMGFGNALGSVGADFSSLSVNPAGIGLYRRGEMMITPSVKFGNAQGTYQGITSDDSYAKMGLNNFGIVATKNQQQSGSWRGVSFGFGFNRLADYNRAFNYQGNNYLSSQSEAFAYDANTYYNEFATSGNFNTGSPAYLGYNSYLIDTFGNNANFVSVVDFTKGLNQKQAIVERGGMSEILFSLGGNYQDKLMLGATIGIPRINYTRTQRYTEQSLSNDNTDYFDNYQYSEDLKVTGMGVNAKFGAIYMPNYNFRVGVALHTPTLYGLSESFQAGLTANTETFGGTQSATTPLSTFDYNIVTPWKAIVSGTAIVGNKGFISLDYEFVDYSAAKFNLNTATNQDVYGSGAFSEMQKQINGQIKDSYQAASNVRLGGEVRLDKLMLRAGAGYYSSPYKKSIADASRIDMSAGVGYRGNKAFIDLGFMRSMYQNDDVAYSIPYASGIISAPTANIKYGQNVVAMTLGIKF